MLWAIQAMVMAMTPTAMTATAATLHRTVEAGVFSATRTHDQPNRAHPAATATHWRDDWSVRSRMFRISGPGAVERMTRDGHFAAIPKGHGAVPAGASRCPPYGGRAIRPARPGPRSSGRYPPRC